MKTFKIVLAAALAAGLAAAAPAQAGNGNGNKGGGPPGSDSSPGLCTLADLSPIALACSGFFQGNLLSNSPSDLIAQASGLALVGLDDWGGGIVEPQLDLTSQIVDFSTPLNGTTFLGIHWGGGADGPSPHTPGGVTAFYRLDAGTNLDVFSLAFGSVSGARLYQTSAPSILDPTGLAVPEPAVWTMMILGFGAAGAMLRRRRAAPAT